MLSEPTPPRAALASEWTFVVLAWLVTAMWSLALLGYGAIVFLGFGFQVSVLSSFALAWALVRRRGLVLPMVRWALLALLGTFALLLVAG